MSPETRTDNAPSMAALVSGIVNDAQTLIRQELALARREMQDEWNKAKIAAESMAAGVGLVALAAVMLCLTIVFILDRYTGIPLWGCFAIVTAALAAAGVGLLVAGRAKASDVNVIPPQTAETMKENVEWIQNPK